MLAAALYNRPMEAISYYPHNPEVAVKSFSFPKNYIITLIAIIIFTVVSNSLSRIWTVLILSFLVGFLAGKHVAKSRMHFEH